MAKTRKTGAKKTGDKEVKIDQRLSGERREASDRRVSEKAVAQDRRSSPRRKVQRRRQIDPTTCERDYNAEEIEFMRALDAYKRSSGRMFPTCSEILEVIRSLGYERPGLNSELTADVSTSEISEPAAAAGSGAELDGEDSDVSFDPVESDLAEA